ncbi:MAG: 4Fe-4S dicluster domain-containing protein [Gemmatimonadota bacterium]
MINQGDGSRRDLFRHAVGDWFDNLLAKAEERVVVREYYRPPGALSEVGFLAACTRCGDCIGICPVRAILKVPTDGGFAAGTPYIDPSYQPCVVCPDMPCAAACPTDALNVPANLWLGLRLGALELDPRRCITFEGTECGVCARSCPVGPTAIGMDDAGHPVIRVEGCVGCGVCVKACVTHPSSLTLSHVER